MMLHGTLSAPGRLRNKVHETMGLLAGKRWDPH